MNLYEASPVNYLTGVDTPRKVPPMTNFVAIVRSGCREAAVKFPTMAALYEWEDAHPEVEVISTMPLVSRNYAEQAAR